ncbi:MAG: hypothetical protein J6X61_05315, partial [Clostridia bacterium]|nr:hypothetical protein [Clostridia bacterium]
MKINRIMKINRMLSLALAICLVAALAASCTEGGSAATASKADSASAVSLTAEDVYGSGVSEETITALQNSGTITIGTSDASIGKGQYSDDLKAEMEFYKKYFGLTIKYRYASFTTDLTRFLVNYANGDANDMTYLSYSSWPKVGIRQVVYSIDELKALGVVGLDHPEITRYEDVASRFTIGGKKYSPGIRYTSPSLCAYNVDLFEQYSVKDPGAYYKEGNWNLDTYMQCCKEISRTLADGTKIY